MRVLKIEIAMDNDAFGETLETEGDEVTRILNFVRAGIRVEALSSHGISLYDVNGNRVGFAKVINRR